MDNLFLESLYAEHRRLVDLINSVSYLILRNGGSLPEYQNKDSALINVSLNYAAQTPGYPTYGTWRDKILFALTKINKPTPVIGIAHFITREEPSLPDAKVHDMVTQNCSSMFNAGDITAIKDGKKNYYALKEYGNGL